MNKIVAVLLVLLSVPGLQPSARAEDPVWRRLPDLEDFTRLVCSADKTKFRTCDSRISCEKMMDELGKECPSGFAAISVPLTCFGNYGIVQSREELTDLLKRAADKCGAGMDPQMALEISRDFIEEVSREVRFDTEALVFISETFTSMGKATASLDVKGPDQGTLTIGLRIDQPPPPFTPNVAAFHFAVAVSKEKVKNVAINGSRQAVLAVEPVK